MSTLSVPQTNNPGRSNARRWVSIGALVVLVVAMGVSTKTVKIGSAASVVPGAFSPAEYGKSEFPKVQADVEKRAVDATTLAAAIAKDKAAAVKSYGVEAGVGPEMPVKFTGVAGKQDSGIYAVTVDGLPSEIQVRVQTGPAIMGTDLRDSTGTIAFGQFTNQIEYQNAGSALNKEMKKQVLSKVDAASLTGKTIAVVGAFQLTDPNSWIVTPVKLEVK